MGENGVYEQVTTGNEQASESSKVLDYKSKFSWSGRSGVLKFSGKAYWLVTYAHFCCSFIAEQTTLVDILFLTVT